MWRGATGRLFLRRGWHLCKTVLLVITMIAAYIGFSNGVGNGVAVALPIVLPMALPIELPITLYLVRKVRGFFLVIKFQSKWMSMI